MDRLSFRLCIINTTSFSDDGGDDNDVSIQT